MEKEIEGKDYITIKKTTLKKTGIIVFLIYVLIFSIFMIVSQVKITNKLDKLSTVTTVNTYDNTAGNVDTLQISAMSYYKDYELDDSMNLTHTKDGEDYMIYFHSDTCHYCLEANVFLNQYITLGYQNNVPIYFATTEKASTLFDFSTKESCEATSFSSLKKTSYVLFIISEIVTWKNDLYLEFERLLEDELDY